MSNVLYQQVILEHNKKPRNFKVLEQANRYAVGKNPLCGDQYAVYLILNSAGVIEDIAFQGDGCAISKASASMMTQALKGKTPAEAEALKADFLQMVTTEHGEHEVSERLGRLSIFEGVKQYPVRVKCATLCWHTVVSALHNPPGSEVSTEE